MIKINKEDLEQYLKVKYNLAVGVRTLDDIIDKIRKSVNEKIKVSGRSYVTGKRIVVNISVKCFQENK